MRMVAAMVIVLVMGALMLRLAVAIPFGAPVRTDMDDYYIRHAQEQTGANNVVTAVLFDYRGLDTLAEATVLFTAVLGVAIMFRKLYEGEAYEND